MTDDLEEFLAEFVEISRLIPTLFSSASAADLRIQFNQRVNKNIERDINRSISDLCDWIIDRSSRTIHQVQREIQTSSINTRRKQSNTLSHQLDNDFQASRQRILSQLSDQCLMVRFVFFLHSLPVTHRDKVNSSASP